MGHAKKMVVLAQGGEEQEKGNAGEIAWNLQGMGTPSPMTS